MTTNVQVPAAAFPGDGVSTVFPLTFPSVEGDDFIVELVQGATRIAQSHGLDWNPSSTALYSVRSIVTSVPVPNGWTLEVQRRTDLSQLTDYLSNDGFPAESHERALDKLTYGLQEQDRRMGAIEGSGIGLGYTFTNIAGTGAGIFAQLVGNDAQFKRLKPGSGVTFLSNASEIEISSTGVPLPVSIANGGTGQVAAQDAINALTQVAGATNEYVLTKDTGSASALWKPAPGVTPPGNTTTFLRGDGTWSNAITGPFQVESNATTGRFKLYQSAAAGDQKRWSFESVGANFYLRARSDDELTVVDAIEWNRGGVVSVTATKIPNGRVVLGANDDASTAFQSTGGYKLHTGNLHLAGTAQLFLARMDQTANGMVVQTNQTNSSTHFTIAPSGSGTISMFEAYNEATPTSSTAEGLQVGMDGTIAFFNAFRVSGSGTQPTMLFSAGGSNALQMTNQGVNVYKFLGWNAIIDDGTSSGAAKTIDFTLGNIHKFILAHTLTFTFTAPPWPGLCYLQLTQDGTGSRVMTLPASVKWTAATAAGDKLLSTGANKRDLLILLWNGTDYLAQLFKDY